MTRARRIGEFRARRFLIAVAIFFAFGWLLYSLFDFRFEPKTRDDLQIQQEKIGRLEERIDQLEKAVKEIRDSKVEQRQCSKAHCDGPQNGNPIQR